MKKTLNIDEDLLCKAKRACNAKSDTETVRLGLEALVRHDAYESLRKMLGTMPEIREVPRRRYQLPPEK
jgi:Arc/MetJ family transcription regulator